MIIAIIVLVVLLYAIFKPLQKPPEVVKIYYIEAKVEQPTNVVQFKEPKLADVIKYDRRKIIKESDNE